MDSFAQILQAVRLCTPEQKQQIFAEIRESLLIHKLEKDFNLRAELILEAIGRAGDLIQRGMRGIIAEMVFVRDVIPTLNGWHDEPPVGDVSYDACLCKDDCRVRVQVKTQRRLKGVAMLRNGCHVVEVQRTRTGKVAGENTRPYRFTDFDLLAVCMYSSTGDWHSFMYAPVAKLTPKKGNDKLIETFQYIPNSNGDGVWTNDLITALEIV